MIIQLYRTIWWNSEHLLGDESFGIFTACYYFIENSKTPSYSNQWKQWNQWKQCIEDPSDRLTNLKTDPAIASLIDDFTYWCCINTWNLTISIVATTSPCYWFVTTKFNFWFIGMSVASMVKIYILISWDGCDNKQSILVSLINHFLIFKFW